MQEKQKQTPMLSPSPPKVQGRRNGGELRPKGHTELDGLSHKDGEWPAGFPENGVPPQSVARAKPPMNGSRDNGKGRDNLGALMFRPPCRKICKDVESLDMILDFIRHCLPGSLASF